MDTRCPPIKQDNAVTFWVQQWIVVNWWIMPSWDHEAGTGIPYKVH
jgi:hypothetical protein